MWELNLKVIWECGPMEIQCLYWAYTQIKASSKVPNISQMGKGPVISIPLLEPKMIWRPQWSRGSTPWGLATRDPNTNTENKNMIDL